MHCDKIIFLQFCVNGDILANYLSRTVQDILYSAELHGILQSIAYRAEQFMIYGHLRIQSQVQKQLDRAF
jgi:hypothetical protein